MKLAALSCLLAAGTAQSADLRAAPPSVAGGAPQTVQDAAVPTVQDANAAPFPCLFGCFGYQPAQTASAPPAASEPLEITPPKAARRKWTQHAFAQSRSARQEGRSVATARKVSRPVSPQTVTYRPRYDMPLDADAVPMEWQLRAEPPSASGAAQPMQVGPFGRLK